MPSGGGPGDLVRIGRVGRVHGVAGGFWVDGAVEPAVLCPPARIVVAGIEREIADRGGTDARPLLRLVEVTSPEEAKALRGEPIWIDRSMLPEPVEGEWYGSDLEGARVFDGEREIGVVARIVNAPTVDLLEVTPPGGGEALQVPIVGDAVVSIDVAQGRIDVSGRFLGLR